MSPGLDEARRHELAARIDKTRCACHWDIGLDDFDKAVADADIASGAERLARIDNIASLDHQIVLVARPKRRTARPTQGASHG
jgi:hypothetical protein